MFFLGLWPEFGCYESRYYRSKSSKTLRAVMSDVFVPEFLAVILLKKFLTN